MSLAYKVYGMAANAEKSRFEKGIGPIIGSKRLISLKTRHTADSNYRIGLLILYLIAALPVFWVLNFRPDESAGVFVSQVLPKLLMYVSYIYLICLLMLYALDLDSTECYFFGYKKSTYALASGVKKKDLKQNKGLIGEYKGYVLSRSLKIPHKVLYNVCVPMPNGNFQEVDCIIITRNIIYVLECKNRGGNFIGKVDDEKWKQYIGRQEHKQENIYIQNQKHTMAIDRFLLEKGIISNGQNVCINTIFSVGDMKIGLDRVPLDMIFGNMKFIKNYIEKNDKNFDDGTDTTGIMTAVYDALLPYSLYTQEERAMLMRQRKVMAENKRIPFYNFKKNVISSGIPGITEPGQPAIIRYNNVYTQLEISCGDGVCWQTRTDIPRQYLV